MPCRGALREKGGRVGAREALPFRSLVALQRLAPPAPVREPTSQVRAARAGNFRLFLREIFTEFLLTSSRVVNAVEGERARASQRRIEICAFGSGGSGGGEAWPPLIDPAAPSCTRRPSSAWPPAPSPEIAFRSRRALASGMSRPQRRGVQVPDADGINRDLAWEDFLL